MKTSPKRWHCLTALVCAALLACACSAGVEQHSESQHTAAAIGDHECAVCGMLVRGQSAPRGQVIHRDGERLFFCSVGDALLHLSAPSPHGSATDIFFEAMTPTEAPNDTHTGEHPWLGSERAVFVVGVERTGIMGPPVLVYDDEDDASALLGGHEEARTLGFDELSRWWREEQAAD